MLPSFNHHMILSLLLRSGGFNILHWIMLQPTGGWETEINTLLKDDSLNDIFILTLMWSISHLSP